jgi:hypothetical protein
VTRLTGAIGVGTAAEGGADEGDVALKVLRAALVGALLRHAEAVVVAVVLRAARRSREVAGGTVADERRAGVVDAAEAGLTTAVEEEHLQSRRSERHRAEERAIS